MQQPGRGADVAREDAAERAARGYEVFAVSAEVEPVAALSFVRRERLKEFTQRRLVPSQAGTPDVYLAVG